MIHRADLRSALYQRAVDLDVTVRFGSRVIEYDQYRGEICLQNWEHVRGDLIVAADGIYCIWTWTI